MDVREAEKHVTGLARDWTIQRTLSRNAAREASRLGKIVRAYVDAYPELESVVDRIAREAEAQFGYDAEEPDADEGAGVPRGAAAVRLILQECPNDWLPVSELVDALRRRGWLPDSENPANAVRTALVRLVADTESDIYKGRLSDGKVVYSYQPDRERMDGPGTGYDEYGEEPF